MGGRGSPVTARLILQYRKHLLVGQLGPAVQEKQLDEEREAMEFASKLLYELRRRGRRASRRQHVVDNEDPLPFVHGILVDFERVGAVFEIVGFLDRFRGQLSGLADWNEAGAEPLCDRAAKNEAAALDADYRIDSLVHVRHGQHVDRHGEALTIAQQRRDVVEEDPHLREVGDVPDVLF